jgi:hypothetical protein
MAIPPYFYSNQTYPGGLISRRHGNYIHVGPQGKGPLTLGFAGDAIRMHRQSPGMVV